MCACRCGFLCDVRSTSRNSFLTDGRYSVYNYILLVAEGSLKIGGYRSRVFDLIHHRARMTTILRTARRFGSSCAATRSQPPYFRDKIRETVE